MNRNQAALTACKRIFPVEIAEKIVTFIGSPTAPLIREFHGSFKNVMHWDIPRRFGNFILDTIPSEFTSCGVLCKSTMQWCTICQFGTCARHQSFGCICSALQVNGWSEYLCHHVTNNNSRYRLGSPAIQKYKNLSIYPTTLDWYAPHTRQPQVEDYDFNDNTFTQPSHTAFFLQFSYDYRDRNYFEQTTGVAQNGLTRS